MSKLGFITILVIFFFACTFPLIASAQQEGIFVTSSFTEEDLGDSLKKRALDTFQAVLNDMDIPATGDPQRKLFIDITAVGDADNHIVLSILEAYSLPATVVNWGAEEQVFYMQFASTTAPETDAGKEVREYMSKEWMEQFVSVHGQHMLVFEEADMQREIRAFLRKLAARQ